MKICHKCGAEWEGLTKPGIKETCSKCGEDLHVCRNCVNFDGNKPYQCKETDIDPVQNKERSNFCDYFQFSSALASQTGKTENSSAKSAFDQLFKK